MNVRVGSVQAFFAPCPRGLETLLSQELARLQAQDIMPGQGGVGFAGPFELCYRVNLESRIASRVLWRVFHGAYRHEEDIYRATRDLAWSSWFANRRTIKVAVTGRRCPLRSLDFVTLRVKDAICDRFRQDTRVRPSVDTGRPDIRIDAFLDERTVTLYIDTSGEPLFKRGLRTVGGRAPLRENLAAGLLGLSGWSPDQTLLDPMCGSGTILMEAAEIGLRRSPGLGRPFAFQKLNQFNRRTWQDLCDASQARQRRSPPGLICGSDLDATALKQAEVNLNAAGLANAVTLTHADVLEMTPPAESGVIVTNPPYGVRTGEAEELARLYPRLGDALKRHFAGWCAYILTADMRLPKLNGLACSKRTPLYNGRIECRVFEIKLVKGSMRRPKARHG